MIEATEKDVGRAVAYPTRDYKMNADVPQEIGVITKVTPAYVFVRFGDDQHSKACACPSLDWFEPPKVESILFLDDCPGRTRRIKERVPGVHCVETADEAIWKLSADGPWDIVFLDHDLGGEVYCDSDREDTGMEVVRWIVKNKPKIGQIVVHTHFESAADIMARKLSVAGYTVHVRAYEYLKCDYDPDFLYRIGAMKLPPLEAGDAVPEGT